MTTVTIFVPNDIATKCESLIAVGSVVSVKKGVEMLLQNNLYIDGGSSTPGLGQRDVSSLLKKGLLVLTNSPHETLGVPIGAKTQEIRKAYKKNALQYHPDKNPLTTPLFQAIHAACDKLSDRETRASEERRAAASANNLKPTSKSTHSSSSATQQQRQQPYEQSKSAHYSSNSNANPKSNPQTSNSYGYQPPPPQQPAYGHNSFSQDEQTRKQRYEDFIKEQQKKVESDRRAKEFAEKQAQRERETAAAQQAERSQRAKYQEEIDKRREEILRQANEANSSRPSAANGQQQSEKDVYRRRSYDSNNTASSNSSNAAPNLRSFKPTAAPTSSSSSSSSSSGAHIPGNNAQYPYNYNVPGPTPSAAGPVPVGRTYKVNADGKIHPTDSSTSGQSSNYYANYSANSGINSSGKADASKVPPLNTKQVPSWTPSGNGPNSARSTESHSARTTNTNPQAPASYSSNTSNKSNVVPRPYGIKCTSVGTTLLELEWHTSNTYKNILNVELSWRCLTAGARQTWESANKLISSGKCRKKNLLAGGQYEFRARAVEELVGGMLGNRSEWSESIVVALVQPNTGGSAKHTAPAAPASTTSTQAPTKPHEPSAFNPTHHTAGVNSSATGRSNIYSSVPSYVEVKTEIKTEVKTEVKTAVPPSTQQPAAQPSFQRFSPKMSPPQTASTTTTSASAATADGTRESSTSYSYSSSSAHSSTPASHTNSTSTGGSGGDSSKAAHRHYYTPITPVTTLNKDGHTASGTALPQATHKFTTLDGSNQVTPPSATHTKTSPTAPTGTAAKPPVTVSARDIKAMLSHSGREAWGKDSIRLSPNTPPRTNSNMSNGTNNIRGNSRVNVKASNNSSGTGPKGVPSPEHYEVDEEIEYSSDDDNTTTPAAAAAHGANDEVDEDSVVVSDGEDDDFELHHINSSRAEPAAANGSEGGIAYGHKSINKSSTQNKKSDDTDSDDEIIEEEDAAASKEQEDEIEDESGDFSPESPRPAAEDKAAGNVNNVSGGGNAMGRSSVKGETANVLKSFSCDSGDNSPVHSRSSMASAAAAATAAVNSDFEPKLTIPTGSLQEEEEYSSEEDEFDGEEEQYYDLHPPPTADPMTFKHLVRAEPFSKSKPNGYLLPRYSILATADCGDWLKVQVHEPILTAKQLANYNPNTVLWGWCLRVESLDGTGRHEYLKKTNGMINEYKPPPMPSITPRGSNSGSKSSLPDLVAPTTGTNSTGKSATTSKVDKDTASHGVKKSQLPEKVSPSSQQILRKSTQTSSHSSVSGSGNSSVGNSSAHAGSHFLRHKNSTDKLQEIKKNKQQKTPDKKSASSNGSGSGVHKTGGSSSNTKAIPDNTGHSSSGSSSTPTLPTTSSTSSQLNHPIQHSRAPSTPQTPAAKSPLGVDTSGSGLSLGSTLNRSAYKIQKPLSPMVNSDGTISGGVGVGIAERSVSSKTSSSGGSLVETWHELFDPSGHAYYFNEDSGESKWEPPEWIEELDAASGHKYYVRLSSDDPEALESTWTKPKKYAKLIRTAN